MAKKNSLVTSSMYELQAEICSALASPIRLHILDLISSKEVTSTDLLKILEIPKANLAQHLSVLKDAGLVSSRKEGQFQYLSVAVPRIKEACAIVRSILAERIANEEKKNSEIIKELKNQRWEK